MTWGAASAVRATFSTDAMVRLGELLDVQVWPPVLAIESTHDTELSHRAAMDRADAELRGAGFLTVEGIVDDLQLAIQIIAAPESQLEARSYTEAGVRRMSLLRSGHDHVLALRFGNEVTIETVSVEGAASAAAQLTALLGDGAALDLAASISAPTDDLVDRLDAASGMQEYTDALYTIGVDARNAATLGGALGSLQGHTEVVASQMWEATTQQSSGAVVIYETARGRVVASPSMSPDGRRWTTFAAGTGHRIRQALGLLVETLPSGRWR